LNQLELKIRETTLKKIVQQAGVLALQHFRSRQSGHYTLKGAQDFLTESDTIVEQYIRQELQQCFPDDGILGEEIGGNADNSQLWVIDPIDGTANFARGIGHFCVVIAFVKEGVTLLGGIYNPVTQELYLARKGMYAEKNGVPLHVAKTPDLQATSFELGWSNRVEQRRYVNIYSALLTLGANIRRGASGALALAWVAEGRTDGYAELHMNAWDCLAGLLLVEEAGGSISRYPKKHADITCGGSVLAAAPQVAQAFSLATNIEIKPSDKHKKSPLTVPINVPHSSRPPMSLIASNIPKWGVDIYIGGSTGAADTQRLREYNITTVLNCAVNLDIDLVEHLDGQYIQPLCHFGAASIRYYKIGLIDGDGNPESMMLAGYHLMRSSLSQKIPDKPSYKVRQKGNILVHCRGGRSRSVTIVALFLHLEWPEKFPTLDSAIAHIRDKRQLHPDEWFEAPKPILIELARRAINMETLLQQADVNKDTFNKDL